MTDANDSERALEVSIVIPCLDEADTLAAVVGKARRALSESAISGEIIVADNGSNDGSPAIAERAGARVVSIEERGYGNALMGGIASARGRFVIMGDADDSYDFLETPKFVDKLRAGFDLVQGCRLPWGGGNIVQGAMPATHRWLGNPFFTLLARWWFDAPIHDVFCGMRGFAREHYLSLDQRCTGMEFAVEMIIKSCLRRARIAEVPITLHRDGRTTHPPHLRTWRDGWRTLRFFLMFSPRWLFFAPGLLLVLLGGLGYGLSLPGATISGATFDVHTLLYASFSLMAGYQAFLFWLMTTTFAVNQGLLPAPKVYDTFYRHVTLEGGIGLALVTGAVGLAILIGAAGFWAVHDFGRLDYATTMRWVIPGATMTALALQTLQSSFLVSILGLPHRRESPQSRSAARPPKATDDP
ncbi:MAG: glycosyltransferase family 2 protein [Deltaproteobacteria bacterium]|nr:glycosyltransferase family 2 protein [Deltaproteobacteria bacterium]